MNVSALILSLLGLIITISQADFEDTTTGDNDYQKRVSSLRKLDGYGEFDSARVFHVNETTGKHTHLNITHITLFAPSEILLAVYLSTSGEHYLLKLKQKVNVLHENVTVHHVTSKGHVIYSGSRPDCFLAGTLISHKGVGSLSTCRGLRGVLTTPEHTLYMEPLMRGHVTKRSTPTAEYRVLVARKRHTSRERTEPATLGRHLHRHSGWHRLRREEDRARPREVEVEMAHFVDRAMVDYFIQGGWNTPEKMLEYIILKWNGIQALWGNPDVIGFNVTFQIKAITFWERNPSWYEYDKATQLQDLLRTICKNTESGPPYDAIFLQTGFYEPAVVGNGYQAGLCQPSLRCAVSRSKTFTFYSLDAHELGHNFNLRHDTEVGCTDPDDQGFMGSKDVGFSSCSREALKTFLERPSSDCLFETDIAEANVDKVLFGLKLVPELAGQYLSRDELCKFRFGSGYRFRNYTGDICRQFGCADHDPSSPSYGRVTLDPVAMTGVSCAPEHMCVQYKCQSWDDLKALEPKKLSRDLVKGAWSTWSVYSDTCSRACGTGVFLASRLCNNPVPHNSPWCEGEPFKAKLCNTQLCSMPRPSDVTLRRLRAAEICSKLITSDVISSTEYLPQGDVYGDQNALDQCEVRCQRKDGGQQEWRLAMLPDGTPCRGNLTEREALALGLSFHCVQGACMAFGCDNATVAEGDGKVKDACGVCGGGGRTCDVIKGEFTVPLQKELWTKDEDSKAVIASRLGSSWVWQTKDNPVNFAAAFWDFDYSVQYLKALGPIDQPVVIKLYRHNVYPNVLTKWQFTVPKSVSECTGTCKNGGKWWMCGCRCPKGFYGKTCIHSCDKFCLNGAPLDTERCTCQCNPRQWGDKCKCKAQFAGRNCTECTLSTCKNCGTFSPLTCHCVCPEGYGGIACEHRCEDRNKNCGIWGSMGWCEKNARDFETLCPMTCAFCTPTDTPGECTT